MGRILNAFRWRYAHQHHQKLSMSLPLHVHLLAKSTLASFLLHKLVEVVNDVDPYSVISSTVKSLLDALHCLPVLQTSVSKLLFFVRVHFV